jgi:hypothetical protein
MALGLVPSQAELLLSTFAAAFPYIKLHLGDPGIAGTANPSLTTLRKQVTWADASPTLGTIKNSVAVTWSDAEISNTEDHTHFSLWSTVGPSGGNFGGSGVIQAQEVNATGEAFTILVDGIVLSFTVAA